MGIRFEDGPIRGRMTIIPAAGEPCEHIATKTVPVTYIHQRMCDADLHETTEAVTTCVTCHAVINPEGA